MRLFFVVLLWLQWIWAYELDFDQFMLHVEKNSLDLLRNKAQFDADLEDRKANASWNTSYVESEVSMGKNAGSFGVESTTLFMLSPRLPWVSSMLSQSLQISTLQYQKSYDLLRNLAVIGAKRIYFSYLFKKEKLEIYTQREQNFFSQLKIAEAKFHSGSVSKKDYANFKSSYYDARASKVQMQKEVMDLEGILAKMLGIGMGKNTIKIRDLKFDYLGFEKNKIMQMAKDSPYISILTLRAKDYGVHAKALSYQRWDSFEIGAGLQNTTKDATSHNQATLKIQLPIPLTTKYGHLKKKYLVLQSAALREEEITKQNIEIEALSYYEQLMMKKEFIDVQKQSIDNKRSLVEMGKVAYESQKISLFEYLAYQNAYMDALIKMAEAKMEYIQTQTLLEETLGVVLRKGR